MKNQDMTKSDTPRVVIANLFPDDNRGGAAITSGTIRAVLDTWPKAKIAGIIISSASAGSYPITRSRYPSVTLLPPPVGVERGWLKGLRTLLKSVMLLVHTRRSRRLAPAVRAIVDADIVISKGGHVFVDRRGFRSLMALWLTAFPLVLGKRHGAHTAVFAGSIGPFTTRSARALNGWILRRVDLILPREERSHREALALGINPLRLVTIPDTAFRLPSPTPDALRAISARFGLQEFRFGCITVSRGRSSGSDFLTFLERFSKALEIIVARGVVDRIVIVRQVAAAGDDKAADALIDRLKDIPTVRIRDYLTPEQLIALYGAGAFTIGCRMHSTIFSLIGHTPAFPVSLAGTKAKGIFEALGLPEYVIDFPNPSPETLARLVEEAVLSGAPLRLHLSQLMQRERAGALAVTDILGRLLPESFEGRQVAAVSSSDDVPPRQDQRN